MNHEHQPQGPVTDNAGNVVARSVLESPRCQHCGDKIHYTRFGD